jgi:hypothetical protein
LQHKDGARLEVKPSAARQTWTGRASLQGRATRGSFDIGGRKGCWIEGGKEHVAWEGRPADLFVFAWHPVIDPARVDHRDPRPWLFFVVPEPALPVRQKRLGLALIGRRWPAVGFADLPAAVVGACCRIARDLLALLGNGVPRAEAAIVAALADRHPKDDIKRAIARLAVLEQLVETGSKHTLAEPGQG